MCLGPLYDCEGKRLTVRDGRSFAPLAFRHTAVRGASIVRHAVELTRLVSGLIFAPLVGRWFKTLELVKFRSATLSSFRDMTI